MVATTEPLSVPRIDQTPALALARVEREERHGFASVKEHIEAKHGKPPRDAMLRMLLRVAETT